MSEFVFETIARRAADQGSLPALTCGEDRRSYAEFDRTANQIANYLRSVGVSRGDRIAIAMQKSADYVCSLFGIMKAGACYVPIDASYPKHRMEQIIADCEIRVMISDGAVLSVLTEGGVPPGLEHAVCIDETNVSGLDVTAMGKVKQGNDKRVSVSVSDKDLAYILYTSGSTGKPKGVMLTHRNLMTFMDWCEGAFDLNSDDRIINTAPFTFDIAGLDMFNAFHFGACLTVVADQKMINTVLAAIQKEKITFMSAVPTLLGAFASRPAVFRRYDLSSLKTIISGAALCQPTTMMQLHEHLPKAELWNLYGPTEATIYCLYHRVDPATLRPDSPIPIGIPFENTEAFVVSKDGGESAIGESGELVLRGSHIAAGYFNNPEKTQAAFRPYTLAPHLGELVYHTGDVVRQDSDGTFHFQGRMDDLVKSRGYRIELNEIDLALAAMGAKLKESISVAVPDPQLENKLVAAVVLTEGTKLTDEEVKKHCAKIIPDYMVPDEVLFLSELPKTSSGKINRKAIVQDIVAREKE